MRYYGIEGVNRLDAKEKAVIVTKEVHYKLKKLSLDTGKTVKSLMTILVDEYIKNNEEAIKNERTAGI